MERDEFVFSGVETGQLHGAFDSFGAAVAEESFCQSTRRDVAQFFREIGDGLHMINVGRAVDELVHLRFGGGDHPGLIVAGVDHRDAGEAVEILAAVDVSDFDAAGLIDHDRHDRLHEAGHHVVFVFLDCVGHECLVIKSINHEGHEGSLRKALKW